MTVVVDTSILIDHLRGDPRAHAVLSHQLRADDRLAASVLTRVEILAGMRSGEEEATHRLLVVVEWYPVDVTLADRAGDLAARYLRAYPGIDLVDFVVAATAQALEAELWTRNLKHFPMLEHARDPYGE